MAITDNLAILIKAEAGQSVITDSIAALSVGTGAGTVTLMEDPTYGYFWRLTGGLKSAALSGMGEWMNANSTTVAMRFRVSNRAANYSRFMIMGSNTDSGLMIGNAGTAIGGLRVGVQVGGSTIGSVAPPAYTAGDMMTAVIRFVEGATDAYSGWYKTVDRVGTNPNYSATSTTASAYRGRVLLQFLTASENLDIFDFAMLTRGVTNAEGAALADDIRGTLYPSAGAHEITISNSVQANTVSDVAIDNGAVGTHNITVSSSQQVNTLSAVTIQQAAVGSGTITTPEIRDWETKNLKTGLTGVQVDVRSIETGALLVRKTGLTTHATTAVCTITDAAIPNVTLCEVMMRCPDGSKGVWDLMSV